MRFSSLIEGLAEHIPGDTDPEIDDATFDASEARPGMLFVARRDWYGDTHARIPEALANGASAVLVSRREAVAPNVPGAFADPEDPALGLLSARLYGHPTRRLRVYGVTGTKGKSTVAYLVEHMLRAAGESPALMGTLCYRFGEASVDAGNTTPDALVIQRFAAEVLARGATALVLEVSSHALAIGRVAGVCFDSVGFTNLGRDHLDFHGTAEAYFEAKARLFGDCLFEARQARKHPAAAICLDTAAGERMRARVATGVPVLTVGGDVHVSETGAPSVDGSHAILRLHGNTYETDTPLIGLHNLNNAGLAAAMVAGTHPAHVAAAWASLENFPGVPGRLERVGERVFVDYAHTPESITTVLQVLRARTDRPLTIVVGCGGDRDRSKRPLMARAAAEGADRVILTSDNPRSEDPERILDDMVAGLPAGAAFERLPDRAQAIARALEHPGVVLIAGKGHERTQTIAGQVLPFDDVDFARRLLAGEPPPPPAVPRPKMPPKMPRLPS